MGDLMFQEFREFLSSSVSVEAALPLFRWVEAQVAAGLPREAAIRHVQQCQLQGLDPVTISPFPSKGKAGKIEREKGAVKIGGMRIPVRNSPLAAAQITRPSSDLCSGDDENGVWQC